MSKHIKIIITAVILLVVGAINCFIVMSVMGFDFHGLSTVDFVTNTYDINDDFDSVELHGNIDDFVFVPASDGKCYVECHESKDENHTVSVKSGVLTITGDTNTKKWNFDFYTESPKITVYIPEGEYKSLVANLDTGDITIPDGYSFTDVNITVSTGDVKILGGVHETVYVKASTGDITFSDLTADEINLRTSTGHIFFDNIVCSGDITTVTDTGDLHINEALCENINCESDTGEFSFINLIANNNITIDVDTGDIKFDDCDADTLNIKTTTGEVSGNLLSDKVFVTKSDTGEINVPGTTEGGKCEIETDTGDITITVK